MAFQSRVSLPIDQHLNTIRTGIVDGRVLIIKAEPGAGKTTRVPSCLMDALPGTVIVLEPRRLAARLSAERVAAERGEEVGGTVGYQVRLASKCGPDTRLVFVTEGVFLRLVMANPTLSGVAAVVIDEFHERHIQTDLALAIVQKLRSATRPDLRLVVMSATLDTAALERYLPNALTLAVEGRSFPVSTEHLLFEHTMAVEERVAYGAGKMITDPRCQGDILVFLTGIQEIRRTAAHLARQSGFSAWHVLPLSAEVPTTEQAKVFTPSRRRKLILATNVAETSLTIPGVSGVLDTGLAKIAGHASWSGMPTLDIKRISQASCIQRTGRAGRTEAGLCYRLFSEADFLSRPAFTPPDIARLDFAETYLDVLSLAASLGDLETDVTKVLPWFEVPEQRVVDNARRLLELLRAVDGSGRLTAAGKRMAEIPLHPRLAAIVVEGITRGVGERALLASCLINEKMLLTRHAAPMTQGDCDVRHQSELVLKPRESLSHSEREVLDGGKLLQVERLYGQLSKRLGLGSAARVSVSDTDRQLAVVLLAGFPDRVAQKRNVPTTNSSRGAHALYNFCLGRGGVLSDQSAARGQPLILAIDAAESLQGKTADRGTMIYVAAAVTEDDLLEDPAGFLRESVEAIWSDGAERVDVFVRLWYGQLLIREERCAVNATHQKLIEDLLQQKLAERWPKPFVDAGDLAAYHERLALLDKHGLADDYPRFESDMFELLLASICEGKRSFAEISARQLGEYIDDQLSYEAKQRLDKLLPSRIRLNNGRVLPVSYAADRPPYIVGYIQDFYGEKSTPAIMDGRLPLSVHLLGPNKRPVQMTGDLDGFWRQGYQELKRELSRNYPKHHWPDDPTLAPPVLHKSRL